MDVQTDLTQQDPQDPTVTAQTTAQATVTDAPQFGAPKTVAGDKNVVLPREAFNARLTQATERGRKAALEEMEAQAKSGGFASMKDMFDTVAALKAGNAGRGPQKGNQQARQARPDPEVDEQPRRTDSPPPRDIARMGRELERTKRDLETERRAKQNAERSAKVATNALNALKAEMAIREQAILAGAKDVDYTVTLLRRTLADKSEADLNAFDETKFFEELREKQPYLFGEVVRPATTGTGGAEPPAPRPGTVANATAQANQTDVNKMKDGEWREHLRKRGLSLDVAGV